MKKANKFLLVPLLVLTLLMSTVLSACQPPNPTVRKVTFNYNYTGAPAAVVVDVDDGKTVDKPTDPTRAGYIFKGWFTEAAGIAAFVFTTAITANRTLYAKWEQTVIRKVTFNLAYAGAPPVTVVDVEDGATVAAQTPTRPGYSFEGWYTAAGSGGTAFNFTTPITADIELFAHWKILEWKVTFDYNYTGAPPAIVVDVDNGATVAVPTPAPTRSGHIFKGWFTDSACTTAFVVSTPITAARTLYAKWAIAWEVIFNYNYTDAPAAVVENVETGTTVAVPQEPTRTGYAFRGWFTDAACTTAFNFTTPITAARTLYAKWENTMVWKVTFDYNYTGAPAATVVDVNNGTTVAEPKPTRTGHIFKGWFTDSAGTAAFNFTTPITAARTLYAKWAIAWEVTFNFNYTDAPAAVVVNVETGTTVAVPQEPTRSRYEFKGWFTDAAGTTAFNFTTPITAARTLYAGWEYNPVNIELNYESNVKAYAGTWTVSKVYAGGKNYDAVANAITIAIASSVTRPIVDDVAYIRNNVTGLTSTMVFGLPAINAILSPEGIITYSGLSTWKDFSMGEVNPENEGDYRQPGPALMDFGQNMKDFGLFLDLVAPGVSASINTTKEELVIGFNSDGQLLLGFSNDGIVDPDADGSWVYCLVFDKVVG